MSTLITMGPLFLAFVTVVQMSAIPHRTKHRHPFNWKDIKILGGIYVLHIQGGKYHISQYLISFFAIGIPTVKWFEHTHNVWHMFYILSKGMERPWFILFWTDNWKADEKHISFDLSIFVFRTVDESLLEIDLKTDESVFLYDYGKSFGESRSVLVDSISVIVENTF